MVTFLDVTTLECIYKCMREQIIKLIADYPKHFSSMIQRNSELKAWVNQKTKVISDNFSEMVYSAINSVDAQCERGNKRKFRGIQQGYGGCGPASKCQCVRDQVSSSVKSSKQSLSDGKKAEITEKRRSTNLQRYGHVNSAQTEQARMRHRQYYTDPENIERNMARLRLISLGKYGGSNPGQTPEARQKRIDTLLEKYGVTNISQIPSTKAKLAARMAEYKQTGHLLRKGYERFKKTINDSYNFTLLTSREDYQGIRQKDAVVYKFKCNDCGEVKELKFHHGKGINCDQCNPKRAIYVSGEEQEIFNYITTDLGITGGKQSDKSIIAPYELDMVFEEQKIAIEYCGLYWHSEASSGKDRNYHKHKLNLANSRGYRLITIFSDEWVFQQDIVKSKLANIFKKTTTVHYARKLLAQKVSATDSKHFQDAFHLQGSSVAPISYGLYTNAGDLVALMTFSKGRKALNTQSVDGEYELVRFVTDGSSVVGGASKLMTAFIRDYDPSVIISYSDQRWSEGNVYKTIGFVSHGEPTVGYWYVDEYRTRAHRFNFTKGKLIKEGADPGKTEWEIMQDLGYDRIWDCGHQKWIWNKTTK